MADNTGSIAVRKTFEGQGYNVNYDTRTGVIRVYDPKTGHSANIMPGTYTIDKTGNAQISPDVANLVNSTIQSGKYTYYPETSLFPNSPYTETYKQNRQATNDYLNSLKESNQSRYNTEQNMLNNYISQQQALNQQAYQQNQAMLNNYINQIQANNQAYFAQQQQTINNYIQQMNNYVQQYNIIGLAILQQYQQQFQNAITQMEKLANPDPTVPDSVKLALNILDKKLSDNIRYINNLMNGKGLYNSSIALNAVQQAQSDISNEKQKVLTDWLDQQHQQMYQATMEIAKMYEDYANNYANLQSQFATKPIELGIQTLQNATNLQSNLNQQQWAAANDLSKNSANFLTQIYNDFIKAQSDIAKTGFSVGMQIYDNFVNSQSDYLQQNYQLPIELQNQYIQNSANWDYQQKLLDLENRKLAAEIQKYLDELSYKQANLQLQYAKLNETQRHNQAMESIEEQSLVGMYPYVNIIQKASQTYGVPANLIAAVISVESSFNPKARSGSGAMGLMQLMPSTAKSLGVTNPYDAEQNIMAGTRYLAQLIKQFGSYEKALAAYNWGPGNVASGKPIPASVMAYVNKVLSNSRLYK